MARLTSYFTGSQSREQRSPGKAKGIPGGVHMQINGMRGLCCGDVPKLKAHCQMRPIPAWRKTVGGGLNVLEKTPGIRQFGKFRRGFRCGRRGSGQSLGCDFKAHEIINGFAHARLRQLLVGAEPEMIVESGPDCGEMPAFFNERLDHGFKRALLVWGKGGIGRNDLFGTSGRLGGAFGSAIHPVVPEGIIAFGLIKFNFGPEFGTYLFGIDAVQPCRELAHGHGEHFLFPTLRRGCDHHNTPSFLVGIQFDALGCPIKPHVLDNRPHGGEGLVLVVDAENGVTVKGDRGKGTHEIAPLFLTIEHRKRPQTCQRLKGRPHTSRYGESGANMCREYTLNGSNRKSPISGGRNAPLKLTGLEMHGIKEMSRGILGHYPKRKAGS